MQMEALFDSGYPSTPTDVTLIDTIHRCHLPMEPFREMLLGQQMDLEINRYQTWEDLRLYCYSVAGAVWLVSAPILVSVPDKDVTEALVELGIAMQLTNILQDIGADARRGRIYLPLEDLKRFSYTEQDLFKSVIDINGDMSGKLQPTPCFRFVLCILVAKCFSHSFFFKLNIPTVGNNEKNHYNQ